MQPINQPIQMIASCSISGEFTPIRFRYENLNCELTTVNVLSVDNRKHKHFRTNNEMSYVCRGTIDGDDVENRCYSYTLRYYIPTHSWSLVNMRR